MTMPPNGGGGQYTGGQYFFDDGYTPRYFRPVPGQRHTYYEIGNPSNTISGYRYRGFRRSLNDSQLNYLRNIQSEIRTRDNAYLQGLVDSYGYRLYGPAYDGSQRREIRYSQDFRLAYQDLRQAQYEAHRSGDDGPDSPLAQALVLMGRRLPTDRHRVGESQPNWSRVVQSVYAMGGGQAFLPETG